MIIAVEIGQLQPFILTVFFILLGLLAWLYFRQSELEKKYSSKSQKNKARENGSLSRITEVETLKHSFLANLSHEIRTPLNGIIGFSELLEAPDLSYEKRKLYVEAIKTSSFRLMNLITDIIDVSKIEAKQVKMFLRECSLNETLRGLHVFYKSERVVLKKSAIEINLHIPDNEDKDKVYLDREILRKILGHLLTNAFKFTHEGYVDFGYRIINNEIEFFVSDTGIGIPTNKSSVIFQSFRQAEDSLNRSYEGAGLGLAIVKGLVDLCNGSIRIDSTPGEGTTFFFSLPYSPVGKS